MQGYANFLNFAPKHRAVQVVQVAEAVLTCTTIYVLSKNKKNIENFLIKFSVFATEKNSPYITWASFRN